LPERRIVTGHIALGAVQVGFGLFPVFGTLAFGPGGLSPLAVGAWRIAVGAIALCALAIWRYGRRAIPAARDLPVFFVCAMLGVAVNQALFLVGLSRSTPMNAGLVMSLIPIFTFGLAAAVRQEQFSASRALGIAVALAGTGPLLFSAGIGELGTYGVGNLLMVTNALMYSGYLVVSKTLTRRYPVLVITAWAYVLSVVAVPFFAWGQRLTPETGATTAWWSLLYILAVPTVLAYLLNMFALARVRASTVAVYVYSQPILSGLASWVVFGEHPTVAMGVAAPALFLGIWLVSRRPPPVQLPPGDPPTHSSR
jgi:drug/metabolite transporter (DMT)-like permease